MKENQQSRERRNRLTWHDRLANWRGTTVLRDLRCFDAALAEIARLETELRNRSDQQIAAAAVDLKAAARAGRPPREIRNRLVALAREAARRTLGYRPFDEQILAALALDAGAVVEMQTGEGKTLAGVLATALHALAGRGAHVLTFNDYLARRDAQWMGPVYGALGLTARFVEPGMNADARRDAYRADVTYSTAKEAGFDHLRDLRAADAAAVVHRGFHFALLDEADSLLIDEARVPLVIAGEATDRASAAASAAALVAHLTPGMHFDTDEYARDVELTEAGISHVEALSGCGTLHDRVNVELLARVNCALHARVLLQRDVDYVVRDGRIDHVDDCTGRVVHDRQWPDGLQAALEAKEGLSVHEHGRVLGSMTIGRFLSRYAHVCGMTGTAQDAADELWTTYRLPVCVIATHRPVRRVDHADMIFATREAKERAVIDAIAAAHRIGRPVLVGTRTVAESERLAAALAASGIFCRVLNARHDAEEAAIIAEAGAIGAVTVATNMAGRGTDIRLGGANQLDHDRVAGLGGLYVIGTNRHESQRIDRQLRGRAGRQGDPGESRFFVCLEDDLLVRYGIDRLLANRVAWTAANQPLTHPLVGREIARAQRIIEGQDFEIRRTLARYSSVVEDQYEAFTARRTALAAGEPPEVWPVADPRRAALVAAVGERTVEAAERAIVLFHMDRLWADHLALLADCREGIHLVRLGGQDPLTRYHVEASSAFERLEAEIEAAARSSLQRVGVAGGQLDLNAADITASGATWTYLVSDDPFKNQMGLMLSGAGGRSVAVYTAALLMPLLLAWGAVDRWQRRRRSRLSRRRQPPSGTNDGRAHQTPMHPASSARLEQVQDKQHDHHGIDSDRHTHRLGEKT